MAKKVTNPNEELMNAYVSEHDDVNTSMNEQMHETMVPQPPMEAMPQAPQMSQATQRPGINNAINRNYGAAPDSIAAVKQHGNQASESGLKYRDNLGYMRIDVQSLPTGGLFYPDDTVIRIRAARGSEIKHWSTMNDQDINQISQVDDILNYIIEKCVSVDMPGKMGSSWKDLKDIDRFYLLLAIREFTFLDGDNELMVPISEGKSIPVTKEMIDFIKIPDEIMKHYSEEEKCFVFHLTNKDIRMYIPSLGASQWLKSYAQSKVNAREGFDSDFLIFAPMLINDFRLLSQRTYEQMVDETSFWSVQEWSLISYVRDTLAAASEPKLTYQDDDGKEVTIPLTFRGGIKALFTIQDPLSILR